MSRGADWMAKRLSGQPAAPVQQQPGLPAVAAPVQPQQVVPVPGTTPAPSAQQAGTQQAITGQENYQQMVNNIEQQTGEHPSILKMSRHWKGGEAMRKEGHLRCPSCDSLNIFTRSQITVMNENTGAQGHAKPRCFDCGWQEGFMPGDQGNWVAR